MQYHAQHLRQPLLLAHPPAFRVNEILQRHAADADERNARVAAALAGDLSHYTEQKINDGTSRLMDDIVNADINKPVVCVNTRNIIDLMPSDQADAMASDCETDK